MSEVDRRRSYWYNAVLIDSDRVLDPQFDDAVIYVTGAQLELLRNVTQYLRRRQTYVSETHPGYYLVPDDSDYDDILAIVSDLEEVLMGNPNTLWGYKERYLEVDAFTAIAAGTQVIHFPIVAAGVVLHVTGVTLFRNYVTASLARLYIRVSTTNNQVESVDMPLSGWSYPSTQPMVLKEGDRVRVEYVAGVVDEQYTTTVRGYQMQVPE